MMNNNRINKSEKQTTQEIEASTADFQDKRPTTEILVQCLDPFRKKQS